MPQTGVGGSKPGSSPDDGSGSPVLVSPVVVGETSPLLLLLLLLASASLLLAASVAPSSAQASTEARHKHRLTRAADMGRDHCKNPARASKPHEHSFLSHTPGGGVALPTPTAHQVGMLGGRPCSL